MKRSPVQSSNVAAIGYDPYTEAVEVEFKPNREGLSPVWRYAPVPRALFADLFGEGASVGAGVATLNVAAIGYDPYTEAVEVEFKPNREGLSPVWRYTPVPRALFADLFGEGASVGAGVATLRMNADVRAMHVDDVAPTPREQPAAEDPFAGALADLPEDDDDASLGPIDDEDDA